MPWKGTNTKGQLRPEVRKGGLTTSLTPSQRKIWLERYSITNNKSHACRAAKCTLAQINNYIKNNKRFARLVQECHDAITDNMEDALYDRGVNGYQEEVYQNGMYVGSKTKYSDRLLLAGLAARRPDRYGKVQQQGDNGDGSASISINATLDLNDVKVISGNQGKLSMFDDDSVVSEQ